jgi:hypothetical protein
MVGMGRDAVRDLGEAMGTLQTLLLVQSEHLSVWDDIPPQLIREVSGETIAKIQRQLRMSALAGAHHPDVESAIRKALMGEWSRHDPRFGGWSYQVERIYRTETQRLFSLGQHETGEAWNRQLDTDLVKIWKHQRAPNVMARDNHVAMDGQVRAMGERFSNGLRYPNDPHGTAAETINCMCYMLIVPPEEARRMGYGV